MTEQAHKDDVDIHKIMKRYERTGIIDHLAKHKGTYMDYPNEVSSGVGVGVVFFVGRCDVSRP